MLMIIAVIVFIIMTLFSMIEASRASVAIKQSQYDNAYSYTNTIAITSGVLAALAVIMLIALLYMKFRPTPIGMRV